MPSKTTPNWTQRPAEEYTPRSVVYTSKNTSLEKWKDMVVEQTLKHQYDGTISSLDLLHGWEHDETPYSFVQKYVSRARTLASRTI